MGILANIAEWWHGIWSRFSARDRYGTGRGAVASTVRRWERRVGVLDPGLQQGPMVMGVCRRVLGTFATPTMLSRQPSSCSSAATPHCRMSIASGRGFTASPGGSGREHGRTARSAGSWRRRPRRPGRNARGRARWPTRMSSCAVLDEEISRCRTSTAGRCALLSGRAHSGCRRPRLAGRPACCAAGSIGARPIARPAGSTGLRPAATFAATELLTPSPQAAVPASLFTATFDAAVRDLTVGKVAGAVAASSAPAGRRLRAQTTPAAWTAFASVLVVTSTLALAALARLGNPGETACRRPLSSCPGQ